MKSMSSAKHRLHNICRPSTEVDVWWSWSVSCMIFSRNKLNRMVSLTVVLRNSSGWYPRAHLDVVVMLMCMFLT